MEKASWTWWSPDLLKIVRMQFQPPPAAVCSHPSVPHMSPVTGGVSPLRQAVPATCVLVAAKEAIP